MPEKVLIRHTGVVLLFMTLDTYQCNHLASCIADVKDPVMQTPHVLQMTPCLGEFQATPQDLLQRQQALCEWQHQLACNAHSMEQQKQHWEQQQMACSANMNSSMASQLQRQKSELDQQYLPAIKALKQELECTHQTAAKEAGKAAQELQQKEQEWRNAFASAQQNANQALLQQKQHALEQSHALAQHNATQTAIDVAKDWSGRLSLAETAAQEAKDALQKCKDEQKRSEDKLQGTVTAGPAAGTAGSAGPA